jgi:predicted nuclease with RNAse H fold
MTIALGVHVMPLLDAIPTPRPSCVVGVDAHGRVDLMCMTDTDDAIVAAVPPEVDVIALDAPLAVANTTGRRPVEAILSWVDVPAFPASTARLTQVYGGLRGVGLAGRLAAIGARVVETLPDLVLREVAWERSHPAHTPPLDLAEYRAAWLAVRPPRYRPKGTGRAVAAGRAPAAALLASVLDLDGWLPVDDPDDWQAIADAAVLDAMACAYAAWRLATDPAGCIVIPGPGPAFVAPADANLRERVARHAHRT